MFNVVKFSKIVRNLLKIKVEYKFLHQNLKYQHLISVLHYTMKSVLTIEKCFNYCLIVLTIVKYVLNTVKSVFTTV